jgi:hypothetical protein
MRRIAPVILLIAACSKGNAYVGNAYAKVVEDNVEVEVFGDPGSTVTIAGAAPFTLPQRQKTLLPLDNFPDGENVVEVRVTTRGKNQLLKARFVKPAGSGAPFVRVTDCEASGTSGAEAVKLTSELGNQEYCWVQSDGTVKVVLAASRGATLLVDGKPVTVGADGKAVWSHDLDPAALALPVESALSDGAGAPDVVVPVELQKGGKTVKGTITLAVARAMPKRAQAVLAAVAGAPLTPPPGGLVKASLVYVPAGGRRAIHVGRSSALGAVGQVAVARDLEGRDAPVCGPYQSSDGKSSSSAPRKLVPIEVTVYDAGTGAELAKRSFDGDFDECPMMVMTTGSVAETVDSRPVDAVVERWLTTLAK